ncbi:MAG: 3-dehydroquinate dehydratase [Bacteroidetes bacterium]|nr:3-dehydroquinate dehydratase [Bacteroidota bacterium]MDA0732412.1 3-dehydroquinate dehydratase [Bacteroidota bacterium]MDA0980171.1 3-dehydroquinate dehydratase [Bacteroidota bacterium]
MNILILNGPNLNMLGVREPGIYGENSLLSLITDLKTKFSDVVISHHQSNVEGELISLIQDFGMRYDGIVFNPGGFSHTSVAIRDAVSSVSARVIEVHISNIHAREEFRRITIVGGACEAVISGFGVRGYQIAVEHLIKL